MNNSGLQNAIKPLSQLLEKGSCLANANDLGDYLHGLAHLGGHSQSWVMSQRLLTVRQQLDSDQELIAAILLAGTNSESEKLQNAWCRLIAGRCSEAGKMSDDLVLLRLVNQLNGAADWVQRQVALANLQPTEYTELERLLLGSSAEQSQMTPILTRVLAAASVLAKWQSEALPAIDKIDPSGGRPDINWCSGRLIQLPNVKALEFQYVLSGTAGCSLSNSQTSVDTKTQIHNAMEWVLSHPWAYLLALIVYEQNIWQVETVGALLLELPTGQSELQPSAVQVLVANKDGDELYCGHLSTFVKKILSSLNMSVFPAGISDAALDAGLSSVINELLTRKVWRYAEGLTGEQGFYQIHPDFSDACYGRIGQPSFARYARHLRQAIRSQAIQWRNDCQSQSKHNQIINSASAA